MKFFGMILIVIGLALVTYVGYLFIEDRNRMLSPIPEEEGIKVIFLTPAP